MVFEEYHELVYMGAFVNSDDAIMNIGLRSRMAHAIFGIWITDARRKPVILTRGDQHLPWLELVG